MENDQNKQFEGFYSPNSTPIPDQLFDKLMAQLSGAELKVLLYICRRTFGFKKKMDNISIKQMTDGITKRDGEVLDQGTGLSKSTVVAAVRKLEAMGVVIRNRRQSEEKGDEATTYSLKIIASPVSKNQTPPSQPVSENQTRGGQEIEQARVLKSNPQETVNKKQYYNPVNVNGTYKKTENGADGEAKENPIKQIPKQNIEADDVAVIVNDILAVTGDPHSINNYRLIAWHIPRPEIYQTLSEVKHDGAENRGALFTNKITGYAESYLQKKQQAQLAQAKANLFQRP